MEERGTLKIIFSYLLHCAMVPNGHPSICASPLAGVHLSRFRGGWVNVPLLQEVFLYRMSLVHRMQWLLFGAGSPRLGRNGP